MLNQCNHLALSLPGAHATVSARTVKFYHVPEKRRRVPRGVTDPDNQYELYEIKECRKTGAAGKVVRAGLAAGLDLLFQRDGFAILRIDFERLSAVRYSLRPIAA